MTPPSLAPEPVPDRAPAQDPGSGHAPSPASAALPPGHRPTGALPVAPGFDRDLHRLWWYTAAGLLSAVVVVAGFLVFVMARRLAVAEGPDASPLAVTVLVAGIAAAVAAAVGQTLATLRLRRAWEEEREPLRRTAVAALLPALLVALTPLAVPSLSAWPVLSLWLSVCLIAPQAAAHVRTAVLTSGAAATLGLTALALVRTPAGPADSAVGVLLWWAMVLLVVLPTVWVWRVAVRLEEARAQAGELAVARERLRFAADLHDVQGHHLQVIALQAELAGRLLEKGRTDQAGAALRDVREQAAEALGETRALVRGLRQVSVASEIENAREVLAATGAVVEVDVDPAAARLAREAARLVGLAVREATTNALRHAEPRRVRLALGPADGAAGGVRLTVTNDGARPPAAPPGTGLAGLAARAAEVSGRLSAGPDDDGGFRLELTVPSSSGATTRTDPTTTTGEDA